MSIHSEYELLDLHQDLKELQNIEETVELFSKNSLTGDEIRKLIPQIEQQAQVYKTLKYNGIYFYSSVSISSWTSYETALLLIPKNCGWLVGKLYIMKGDFKWKKSALLITLGRE